MRVIVVGSEKNIFREGSVPRERIASSGALFDELHLIVFTPRGKIFAEQRIAENVYAYPTRSWFRLFHMRNAFHIARKLLPLFKAHPTPDGKTVVSAQDPFESGVVATRIAVLFGAKLHLQVHTDFLSPLFAASPLNRVRVALARKIIPKADRIRVVSERIKQSIVESGMADPQKIDVLPVYVDKHVFDVRKKANVQDSDTEVNVSELLPNAKFIILMASRLSPEKDIGTALRAVAEVIKEEPYVGLLVAGDGPEKKKLMRLAYSLGLRKHVCFIPWQRDLSGLYRSANMLLLSSSFEGYGLTIVEAALSGIPIVSTKVGIAASLKDGEQILLCDIGDRECLARKIRLLVKDPSLRQILRVNGRLAVAGSLPDRETYNRLYRESIERAFL